MPSSQCRIVSNVQDLFHIALCKSGIVPVLPAEAPESYGELMTDSASRVKSGFHERRGGHSARYLQDLWMLLFETTFASVDMST
jgi:hypothetical protein